MKTSRFTASLLALAAAIFTAAPAQSAEQSIIVQSTTSTANSGLYKYLVPIMKQDTGVTAHVVAVGTGQAIKNAKNCDGDVLLVHAKASEQAFVAAGYGVKRFDLMYNDFVIVGPAADKAGIAGMTDAAAALRKIAGARAIFASRGDNSGTHKKEVALWTASGADPSGASGGWYRETGSGMGATLNAGVGMSAYVLTDRATWISFKNKGNLAVMVEGGGALFNQYGVMLVNMNKCPRVKADLGRKFIGWLLSPKGQSAIAAFKLGGKQLFFPNAKTK